MVMITYLSGYPLRDISSFTHYWGNHHPSEETDQSRDCVLHLESRTHISTMASCLRVSSFLAGDNSRSLLSCNTFKAPHAVHYPSPGMIHREQSCNVERDTVAFYYEHSCNLWVSPLLTERKHVPLPMVNCRGMLILIMHCRGSNCHCSP